ncbi:MAG: polyprenol monophosphomannose synthase [Alphaproteobacteria bacterium]
MSAIVIIPTYNERDNLGPLTQRLLDLPVSVDVVFVDDGSPDGTGAVADELARASPRIQAIHRERKLGFASAVIEGFRVALKGEHRWVLQMDADLSHDPAAIPAMLAAAPDHDLVLGSRYVGGVRVIDWDIGRMLLSRFANGYTRAVTGIPAHDITTGFRCYRRSMLESLDLGQLKSNGYAFQIEMAYLVWRSGGRLTEVPIIFSGRQRGASKMSKRIMLEAAILVWRLRVGGRTHATRIRRFDR